jgi:hypothetical protein
MDINDIYDEWYITNYIFGYKNSELDFIQDYDYINSSQIIENDEINYDTHDTQLMENNEINDDSPSPSTSPQLIENYEINENIYSSRIIKTVWPIKILNLNTREINKYIKNNNLTHIKIQQLKKERRRLFNRIYARTSREKKKDA